jgi:Domain of unknown function (DUF4180)
MSDTVSTRHGTRVLLCTPDGPALASEQDTADLLGVAFSLQADLIAVPLQRLDERFFTLRTGVAGAIVGKIATYRRRLAVIGDISAHLAASESLRDFVAETNRGRQVWFVADLAELDARLAPVRN